jgi:phosphoglycerate kinase
MASYRTLDDLPESVVKGKRVLVRADLNVPMKNGVVTDALRIERQAPTIKELAERGARVIVLSHFDRPGGKVEPAMSLKPLAIPLADAIGRPVAFARDCIAEPAIAAIGSMQDGDVVLLENTRFHAGEEKNDPAFSKALATLGEIYVNDAFSAAHRAHASTEGLARLLPAYAGRAMASELLHLHKVLDSPERPVMAVVGGAKISSKIDVLNHLSAIVDVLVIGGAMANTFLAAQGFQVGKSLVELDQRETAKKIISAKVMLPRDLVVAQELAPNARSRITVPGDVEPHEMILDVGPRTVTELARQLKTVKTVVWNGPLGAFETPPFDRGTVSAAQAVAELTREGKLLSVAGGGDTVAALAHAGVMTELSYVSTAGGAFLEWLEGRTLPGVAALMR